MTATEIKESEFDTMVDQLRGRLLERPFTAVVMVAVESRPAGPDNLQKICIQRACVNANSFDLILAADDIIQNSIRFLVLEMRDNPKSAFNTPATCLA